MYDLIIIGGGSACFNAAITASNYKKKVRIIEKCPFGGRNATLTFFKSF